MAKRVFDRQTDRQTDRDNVRNSNIELIKIIAIFLIVITHVTNTLTETNTYFGYDNYVFPLGISTKDSASVILMLLYQMGTMGNSLFFVCTAWFLTCRDKFSRKKAFSFLCMVWAVSFCILVVYLGIDHYSLSLKDIIKSLLPTTFSNNWYLTCYIIFLFIYPYLNKLITMMDQKCLLRIVLFSAFLWICANYLVDYLFFPSRLILWVTIYFLIAYLKTYCKNLMSNLGAGIVFLVIGIVGFVGQVVITNLAGLHIDRLSNQVMRWNNNCSPFYIMIAIGSLIIALRFTFKSRFINYVSSLSLFIYLIHQNYLFKSYTRPKIWQWLYTSYGYDHVVLLDLGFSVALFLASLLLSAVYKETIQRLVTKISDKLYVVVSKAYGRIERFLLEKIN